MTKRTKVLTVRLTPKEYRDVERCARQTKRTVSQVVRVLVAALVNCRGLVNIAELP